MDFGPNQRKKKKKKKWRIGMSSAKLGVNAAALEPPHPCFPTFFLFYIFIVLVFIIGDEINTCLGYPLK